MMWLSHSKDNVPIIIGVVVIYVVAELLQTLWENTQIFTQMYASGAGGGAWQEKTVMRVSECY